MKSLRLALALGAASAAVVSSPALAQQAFGERVTFIVGYAPGGGYDTYARLAAPHFARNLPGSPQIVVQNMPGADSLTALNHLYNRAPKDGSMIATFSRTLAVAPLLGQIEKSAVHYDPAKLFWVGSFNNEVSVVAVWAASGIRTIQDAQQKEVLVGATGLTSNNATYPYVANNVMGTKFKVIVGYPGTSHMTLAMERGEIHGNAGWSWSSVLAQHREWYEQKKINVLMQVSTVSHPDLKDVPLIVDFAKNDIDRKAMELVFAPLAMGRPVAAPPDMPAERGKALRDAFNATMKDPQFSAAAQKAKLDVTPVTGEDIQKLVTGMYGAPGDVVTRAKQIVERNQTTVSDAPGAAPKQ